jgi:hypothetical protein
VTGSLTPVRLFIGLPWQDSGDPHRRESFEFVSAHLARIFPGVDIATHASGHTPFNLAACRNGLASEAMFGGYDVMLLCDADLILDPDGAHAAVNAAMSETRSGLHLPFHSYRALTPKGRRMVLDGAAPDTAPAIAEFDWSVGGAMVCRPDTWWLLGGQDERFQGWGGEDTAFYCASLTLLSNYTRHQGTAYHLWHPSNQDPEDPHYIANFKLLDRYGEAKDDRAAMQGLINEHTQERGA